MKIAIYINEGKPAANKAYRALSVYLRDAGHSFYAINYKKDVWAIAKGTTLILCIGGDGTLLRAARYGAAHGIDVLGVNGGNLGFLSATGVDGALTKNLDIIFKGKAIKQRRMLLCVKVKRSGKTVFKNLALNDCVLKTTEARAAYLSITYDKTQLKDYFGDGLIISTPTGSTAYSLAAGGPIAHPQLEVFVLTPICAHTLNQRPLVLPAGKTLSAQISQKRSAALNLSIDGQINFAIAQGDIITITKSKKNATLIMPCDYDFFEVLTSKLKWGSR